MDAPKCKTCGERHYGLCPTLVGSGNTTNVGRQFQSVTPSPKPPKKPNTAVSDARGVRAGPPASETTLQRGPAPSKNKGGRPKTVEGEPWVAAGVSKRTWYRNKKRGKP